MIEKRLKEKIEALVKAPDYIPPHADLGYCTCGTVWIMEAFIAQDECPDCHKKVVGAGFITTINRTDESGRKTSNEYVLHLDRASPDSTPPTRETSVGYTTQSHMPETQLCPIHTEQETNQVREDESQNVKHRDVSHIVNAAASSTRAPTGKPYRHKVTPEEMIEIEKLAREG